MLIQAASDEEEVVGRRTEGPKSPGLEQAPSVRVYIYRSTCISRLASCKWNREPPSFHKFQQFIDWLQKNGKWKFATGNRK